MFDSFTVNYIDCIAIIGFAGMEQRFSEIIREVKADQVLMVNLLPGTIHAGFPSPAADFIDDQIDLNAYLVKHPSSTFIAAVEGFSMVEAGISNKDLLIIDKSLEPADGKIAVCIIDGEFTLKRLRVDTTGLWLMPANPKFKPTRVTEYNDFEIWGIVTFSIQRH